MAIQRKISRKANQALLGKEMSVLVEGPSPESDLLWQARLSTQAPEIDGLCYISDPGEGVLAPGQIRRLVVTEAHDYDLVGNLIDTGVPVASAQHHFPILAPHATPNPLPHR